MRRRGREAEGGGLLNRYTVKSRIEGSNPSVSAKCWSGTDHGQFRSWPSPLALIRVIYHPINRGYGASIKTGISQARGAFVATYDGDGQHNPADLVRLCQKIHEDNWALVVGARTKLLHSSLWRMPGKWLLGWLANFLSRTKIPDLNSGLRVFRKEIISRYLHLCADRFFFLHHQHLNPVEPGLFSGLSAHRS